MSSPFLSRQIRKDFALLLKNADRGRNCGGNSPVFVNYLVKSKGFSICTPGTSYNSNVNYFNNRNKLFSQSSTFYRIRFFSTAPKSDGQPADLGSGKEDSQNDLSNAVKAYTNEKNEDVYDVVEELGLDSEIGREKMTVEELFEIPDYNEYLMSRITDLNGTRRSFFQKFLPVDHVQQMFITVHDYTNLSWGTTICLITLFFKILLVPIWSRSEKSRRLNAHLVPKVVELQEKAKQAFSTKNHQLARETQMQIYEITKTNSFMKGVLIQSLGTVVQGFMFGTVYGGLRLFAISPRMRPDFSCEPCLWLDSLCLPDPYFILPSIFGILMTIVFEHNFSMNYSATASLKGPQLSKIESRQKVMKIFSRLGIVVFTLYGFTMPSSAFFYLIPSFLFQTILRYSCNRFNVSRFLGIPLPSMKKSTP